MGRERDYRCEFLARVNKKRGCVTKEPEMELNGIYVFHDLFARQTYGNTQRTQNTGVPFPIIRVIIR